MEEESLEEVDGGEGRGGANSRDCCLCMWAGMKLGTGGEAALSGGVGSPCGMPFKGEWEREPSRGKLLELADLSGIMSDCGGLLCMEWWGREELEAVMLSGLEPSTFRDCVFQSSFLYNISLFRTDIHSSVSTSELAVSLWPKPGHRISKVCFFSGTLRTSTTSWTLMKDLGDSCLAADFSSLYHSSKQHP